MGEGFALNVSYSDVLSQKCCPWIAMGLGIDKNIIGINSFSTVTEIMRPDKRNVSSHSAVMR